MFLGHFGLGFAGKRVVPAVGLGTLFLSVQFADLLFWLLAVLGIERFRIARAASPLLRFEFIDYPISHSLAALLGWGILVGLVYFLARRSALAAAAVGLGIVSHWFLDVLVHRPDMPVLPRGPYVGLGLWNSVPLTVMAELALYGVGILIYERATAPVDRIGEWALWSLVVFLAAIWIASLAAPPPPSERSVELSGVAMWLFVPWGYWIDRHRTGAARTI